MNLNIGALVTSALFLLTIVILVSCVQNEPTSAQIAVQNNPDILQIQYKDGKIREIMSFKARKLTTSKVEIRNFWAVWYLKEKGKSELDEEGLVIYEKVGEKLEERFRYIHDGGANFQEFSTLGVTPMQGIRLTFDSSDYLTGDTIIIGLVNDQFKIIFQGGTTELVDLNGDGYAEIFESEWPDGDGSPKKTTLHVWNGNSYQKLAERPWDTRFDSATKKAVDKYFAKQME